MNFNTERENNIIKNIAKEIVYECSQRGLEVSQELAAYMVKLILLNPKHGFTASEVMPRTLTQQLVAMVVEELKQDTPAMNCIKMQVYWETVKLNVAELKKDYHNLMAEKAEPYLNEIVTLEREDYVKIHKVMANYFLVSTSMGNPSMPSHVRETVAAFHSIFKAKDDSTFFDRSDEAKTEMVKNLAKRTTGIRLYLKHSLKTGEGIEDVKKVANKIADCKDDLTETNSIIMNRVDDIRETINNVISMDYFLLDPFQMADVYLPPECDVNDLNYAKSILAIMLQHNFYLNDVQSVLDEIDGNVNYYLSEFNEVLEKLETTIRKRETVPTSEIYGGFDRLGELWIELQSYCYCLEAVESIMQDFMSVNKKEYFIPTTLESIVLEPIKHVRSHKKSMESERSLMLSSTIAISDEEECTLEFNGFCAWTLYFTSGLLVPGNPLVATFKYQNLYYSFSSKSARELWSKEPQFYIMQIYEYVRNHPELVELLKLYDALYSTKNLSMEKAVERKVAVHHREAQTALHPAEKLWDKDYTFSVWELKKRALALSRLVKCVTKSVQTVSPHSHFRASIGLLAAPDKDKEVQTKKDSSCGHPTIARYLYGLRGHQEDKFRMLELTRPLEENCERVIELQGRPTCREREAAKALRLLGPIHPEPCPESSSSSNKCDYYYGFDSKTEVSDNTETPVSTYYLEYNAEG